MSALPPARKHKAKTSSNQAGMAQTFADLGGAVPLNFS
jgi:hypothetical protein